MYTQSLVAIATFIFQIEFSGNIFILFFIPTLQICDIFSEFVTIYIKNLIMEKTVKLTESDLKTLVKRIIKEEERKRRKRLYYHILEYGNYGEIGYQGVYDSEEEAKKRIKSLSDMFPDVTFELFTDTSSKEPPITTV
jgi:hypothetical protein